MKFLLIVAVEFLNASVLINVADIMLKILIISFRLRVVVCNKIIIILNNYLYIFFNIYSKYRNTRCLCEKMPIINLCAPANCFSINYDVISKFIFLDNKISSILILFL